MKKKEFIDKAIEIATKYKSLYVMGCFGAPMTPSNKIRYSNNYAYNKARKSMIEHATSDTYGWDCVCLIKGILWNWNGDMADPYGGAKYCSNGVPDFGTESLMSYCTGVSSSMNNIEAGEVLYMYGHCGIYIGDGKVVEATPKWKNGAQITNLSQRKWEKHGKLKWIDYTEEKPMRYNKIEDLPEWAKEPIQWYMDNGYMTVMDLSYDMVRILTICYRAYKEGNNV